MRRMALQKLLEWKASPFRQPLLLKGARQVGKTHLLKEFGEQNFSRMHYFNFEEQPELSAVFADNISVDSILKSLRIDRNALIENQELMAFADTGSKNGSQD